LFNAVNLYEISRRYTTPRNTDKSIREQIDTLAAQTKAIYHHFVTIARTTHVVLPSSSCIGLVVGFFTLHHHGFDVSVVTTNTQAYNLTGLQCMLDGAYQL